MGAALRLLLLFSEYALFIHRSSGLRFSEQEARVVWVASIVLFHTYEYGFRGLPVNYGS